MNLMNAVLFAMLGGCGPADSPVPGEGRLAASVDALSLVAAPPCSQVEAVSFRNEGDAVVRIEGATVASDAGWLTLDDAPELPFDLAPGEALSLKVAFAPDAEGTDQGELVVLLGGGEPLVVSLVGDADWAALGTQTVTVGKPLVDVVLLVDQSGSMVLPGYQLGAAIPGYITALDAAADWHLMLITEDDGCLVGGVLDAATPNAAQLVSDNVVTYNAVRDEQQMESLLELASMALAQTGVDSCNVGFLRPGAALNVLVMSDEPERSGVPWEQWVADLRAYAPTVVSGAVALEGTCGDGGATGYLEAAEATGGTLLDICDSSWADHMDQLAPAAVEGTFPVVTLAADPLVETLTVSVDGVMTTAFTFDPALRQVTLTDLVAFGAQVEVNYAVAAVCD